MEENQRAVEPTLFYDIINSTYNANAKVQIDQYCNGVTIVNIGATVLNVNGIPLAPPIAPALIGESASFGGNRNEIFYGRIDIAFAAGAGSRCIVQQKIYVKFQVQKPFELT